MDIEPNASESRALERSHQGSPDATSFDSTADNISATKPTIESEDVIDCSRSGVISEDQATVKKDSGTFTQGISPSGGGGSVSASELVSIKSNAFNAEGDCEDAKSTSSSHPFSSPNTSEQDDNHAGSDALTHSDIRKFHRRRRQHNDSASSNIGITVTSVMPGNRPPFPLSERQQMALAMQLSAQDQPAGDHPKSPSTPASTLPSTSGGRARGKLAKVHRRNERGETPLHLAAKRGEFQHCQELIDDGADVNCVDYAGWTPLHEACNQGWYKTAKVLVEHGANVNVYGLDDDTPLHDAALSGHLKLVVLLLRHGADPLKYNKDGKRPIDVAEDPEVKRLMFEGPTKCSSPISNYSTDSAANEENDRTRLSQDLDKTLTASEIGLDASTPISSTLATPDVSAFKNDLEEDALVKSPVSKEHETEETSATQLCAATSCLLDTVASCVPSTSTGEIMGDNSSNAAYASTESENEQRLVVVEDEAAASNNNNNNQDRLSTTNADDQKSEDTLRLLITASIEPSASTSNVSTKTVEAARATRPKRHLKQRHFEPARCGVPGGKVYTDHQTTGPAIRGKKRKSSSIGTKSKDVYEFHSSDSDDDTNVPSRKLKKFSKVNIRMKEPLTGALPATMSALTAATTISNALGESAVSLQQEVTADAETKVTAQTAETVVSREEERENGTVTGVVAAVSSGVVTTVLNLKNDPDPLSSSTGAMTAGGGDDDDGGAVPPPTLVAMKSPSGCSKDDIQLADGSKEDETELTQQIRGRSSSQSMLRTETGTTGKDAFSSASRTVSGAVLCTGSRKERLLGFGRRRPGFGAQTSDHKSQKEREAHIETVVASIGSGLTTALNSGPAEDANVAVASTGEQAQAPKKKSSLELAKAEIKQEKPILAVEEQQQKLKSEVAAISEDDPAAQGSPKVPPLKLVLAGRSSSEEDNTNSATSSRETSGRTYVVRSRANSPSSADRRGSIASDLLDASCTMPSSKHDECRRSAVGNSTNSNTTAQAPSSSAGNGGGEASQRVTRSQVRLHGVQLDRSADDPAAMTLHPRKRKLRSAKAMIEPIVASRTLQPTVSPSLAAIAVKNSYEARRHMKKEIANKWKQEMFNSSRATNVVPTKGYEHFLINKKTYLLQGGLGNEPQLEESVAPTSAQLPPELADLQQRQAAERREMEIRHKIERERLIMACESEAMRDHSRCVRGTPDPTMSVMRILRDADLYNPLQLDKDVPFSLAASTGEDFLVPVGNIASRFDRPKRHLVGRHRLEAQCLFATQTHEWEMKLRSLLLQAADGPCSASVNIPQLAVVDEFPLLPFAS